MSQILTSKVRKYDCAVSKKLLLCGVFSLAMMSPLAAAHAGAVFNFGDGGSLSVGLGLRASATSDNDGAPSGGSSTSFSLDSVRLYVNGQLNKSIGATFNVERDSDGNIKVLDGYARFEPTNEFNIWVGRMLPPSDRSNLDGPYYISSYNYPGVVSQYPAKFDGRDDGVTVWGKVFEKHLTYAVGAFDGHNRIAGASNQGDNPLFAGRVAYNFWDVEDNPGYYESSTYYGGANILTIGLVGQSQKNGVGTLTQHGDYTAWNVDGLLEKKVLNGGAVTLEGAYYHYDTGGVKDVAPNFGGATSTDNVGGLAQGTAYLVSAGFLFPTEIGIGKFQPVVRYQEGDATLTNVTTKQTDVSLNYIIKGHSARLSVDYAHTTYTNAPTRDAVTAGLQLQF
jgi:hypothetical protein